MRSSAGSADIIMRWRAAPARVRQRPRHRDTAYLANGGTLETAAALTNHASTRSTQLYDRRGDRVSLDEVECIRL